MAGLNLVVTGKPGVGKTTLVERVVDQLRGSLRLAGFTTAEIRGTTGERLGFRVVTVDGREAELARVGLPSPVRVGRYGVNVGAFKRSALPELGRRDVHLIVIEEIGNMECTCESFCGAVTRALDAPVSVLATLGIGQLPFFESVRRRPDVELLTLTERNRDIVGAELCARLRT